MTTIPHISPRPARWQAQAMRWHRALSWVAGMVLVRLAKPENGVQFGVIQSGIRARLMQFRQ